MCEICDRNISNEKYDKLRNCLFKMKTRIKLFLEWLLAYLFKRAYLFEKMTLGLSRRQMNVESLPNSKLFLILLVQIEKNVFFEITALLTKLLIPGRFIFLK